MRTQFQYDLSSDARNWQRIISGESRMSSRFDAGNIPKYLLDKLMDSSKEEGLEILKEYLADKNKNRDDLIKSSLENLRKAWSLRERTYFQALNKVLQIKIKPQKYQADMTTATIAPYYWPNNWFMVSAYCSLPAQITNIAHEVFHIEFLKNYHELLESLKVGGKKKSEITEDIACLLNTNLFNGIIDLPDRGYENRGMTRDNIITEYEKGISLKDIVMMLI